MSSWYPECRRLRSEEDGWTHEALAEFFGKSVYAVRRALYTEEVTARWNAWRAKNLKSRRRYNREWMRRRRAGGG